MNTNKLYINILLKVQQKTLSLQKLPKLIQFCNSFKIRFRLVIVH